MAIKNIKNIKIKPDHTKDMIWEAMGVTEEQWDSLEKEAHQIMLDREKKFSEVIVEVLEKPKPVQAAFIFQGIQAIISFQQMDTMRSALGKSLQDHAQDHACAGDGCGHCSGGKDRQDIPDEFRLDDRESPDYMG